MTLKQLTDMVPKHKRKLCEVYIPIEPLRKTTKPKFVNFASAFYDPKENSLIVL